MGALSLPGNPYDGHTVDRCLEQIERISPVNTEHLFTDQGYRGHGLNPSRTQIHVDKKRRGRTPRRLWKWMKRRAAVEPGIGHLKEEHRLNRNRLWGPEGDMHNVILSASGMNFRKLLKHLRSFWLRILGLVCGSRLGIRPPRRLDCPVLSHLDLPPGQSHQLVMHHVA